MPSEVELALDFISERAYEIGYTHDPRECDIPSTRVLTKSELPMHICAIKGHAISIHDEVRKISNAIGWKGYPMPFEFYYTTPDPVQTNEMLKRAATIQIGISKLTKGMPRTQQQEVLSAAESLVVGVARLHKMIDDNLGIDGRQLHFR